MVNIWQTYYDDTTKANLDPAWHPYDNTKKLTEFFENSVIEDLILRGEHWKEKYFALLSHDVKESVYFREDGLRFSPENLKVIIARYQVDVFSFQKRREQTNIVRQAETHHPGFMGMMKKVLDHCGMQLPERLDKIVLFNLMVCTGEFWQNYYNDLLRPAMEILRTMPEAYEDSGYALLGRKDMNDGRSERFMKAFGKEYYPYHPFICERLASVYLQLHPEYSFKHIF